MIQPIVFRIVHTIDGNLQDSYKPDGKIIIFDTQEKADKFIEDLHREGNLIELGVAHDIPVI